MVKAMVKDIDSPVSASYQELDAIFHPASVAVIGASPNPDAMSQKNFLRPLLTMGFKGPVYPVNPKATEILGLKVYPSISDVPGSVDLAIVCIPAPQVPQLLKECITRRVKAAHLFTSDFGEAEDKEEGNLRAQEVLQIAHSGGIRLIGPNCMGIYCPSWGIGFAPGFSTIPGSVAVFSQSGGNAREFVELGMYRGLRFSKVVSYGNALDLNEADFLQYFMEDPETKVIAAYVEGVQNGPRFANLLKKVTVTKPVVILKGGRTEAGTRAVASHTGSLAGSVAVWEHMLKQSGAIQVSSLDELADQVVTCLFFRKPRGNRATVVGAGGGISVLAADDCECEGLRVPVFSPGFRKQLQDFTPGAGSSVRNPVDSPLMLWDQSYLVKAMRLIADYPGTDILIVHMAVEMELSATSKGRLEEMIDTYAKISREHGKPLAMVLRSAGFPETSQVPFDLAHRCLDKRLPAYPTIRRAAKAISKYMQYSSRLEKRHLR